MRSTATMLIGIVLSALGFVILVAGAVLAATVDGDGSVLFGIQGWALVLGGFGIGTFGLWLAGVDWT